MRVQSSELQLVFCDDRGDQIDQGILTAAEVQQRTARLNTHLTKQALLHFAPIRDNRVEKPAWFREQECSARDFVQKLGLSAAKGTQITVVDASSPEVAKQLFTWDSSTMYTQAYYCYPYGVVVRGAMLELAQQAAQPQAIAKLLVHELVHAAEQFGPKYYQYYNKQSQTWETRFRQGFITQDDRTVDRGAFFSEAFAEYAAGLYTRRLEQPDCGLIDTTIPPSPELPSHYLQHNVDTGTPCNEGPDAYALEVIACHLERESIMGAEDFIRSALGAYSLDATTRLAGLRILAHGVNRVQSGLYSQLRDLPHESDAWQRGLELVLGALKVPQS